MKCRHGVRAGDPAICESDAVCVFGGEVLCRTHAEDKLRKELADLNRNFRDRIAEKQYEFQLALDKGVEEVDNGRKTA